MTLSLHLPNRTAHISSSGTGIAMRQRKPTSIGSVYRHGHISAVEHSCPMNRYRRAPLFERRNDPTLGRYQSIAGRNVFSEPASKHSARGAVLHMRRLLANLAPAAIFSALVVPI